jgi:hypothetical protein
MTRPPYQLVRLPRCPWLHSKFGITTYRHSILSAFTYVQCGAATGVANTYLQGDMVCCDGRPLNAALSLPRTKSLAVQIDMVEM